jgi:type III secretion protein Q
MHDSTTVIVEGQPAPARQSPTQPRARRVSLSPLRKLTRAHLGLAARPSVRDEAHSAMESVAAFLTQQLGTPITLEAKLCDATLHPVTHVASRGAFALFELNTDGVALLELDAIALGALLHIAAGNTGPLAAPLHPTRIEEAALGWLVLASVGQLRRATDFDRKFRPRLLGLYFERSSALERIDARRKHLAIDLTVKVGDTHGGARLLLPATWLLTVLEPLAVPAPEAPPVTVLAATLAARCFVGHVELGAIDAAALTQGDVLLLPGVTAEGAALRGPVRLRFPSFQLTGLCSAAGFTPTLTPAQEQHPMSDELNLPVEVEVELTRVCVPLHELGQLKQGGVLPLHISAAQTVVLRVGDRAVARAELVDVEGEIGARILAML